ncbi:CinA family protein [Lentilactobacillus kosonis]|uniref:Molybdopterin binding motif, CinA N-terminal domain n=1 Tax=Lentilactobacillus kosonis TaxID=2810561 RepID=A0A401FI47_9LACO|nr:CinA family protein [Lentilactobacillus kosonis]GAY72045.1 molybdopterin binding motif, CinA N-terminal domain [Lentilactobacillus kosonis]
MDYQKLITKLNKQHLTITAVESLTGGTFQSELVKVPEAGNTYLGGFITYATESKSKILGISEEFVDQYGVVGKLPATEMAIHARQILDTDISISFTGAAGPDKLEGYPVGTVFIGIADRRQSSAHEYHFNGDSSEIVTQACQQGIDLLLNY